MALKLNLPQRDRDFKKEWNDLPKGTLIRITGVGQYTNYTEEKIVDHVIMKVQCKDGQGFFSQTLEPQDGDRFLVYAIDLTEMAEWTTPFAFEDGDLIWEVIPNGSKLTVVQP